MTFFLNNPPSQPEAAEPGEAQSHSPKSSPLFKQDTTLPDSLPGQHISLSAYISKHLQANEADAPALEAAPAQPAKLGFGAPEVKKPSANALDGQYLNNLDVELAAGLEQYLPSPLFRMRVMKKRLDGEIAELRLRLNKYERLPNPSPDMKERMDAVRSRLKTLLAHEREVSQQLASAMALGPLVYGLSRRTQGMGGFWQTGLQWWKSLLMRLVYGNAYFEIEAAGDNLRNLQELFAERLGDKTVSPAEISQILNRYEQTVRQMETKMQRLNTRSFPWSLWQETRRLVK